MVSKIIFCAKLIDIQDEAGRKMRKRRTYAIANLYELHGNKIKTKENNFLSVLLVASSKIIFNEIGLATC